MRSSGSEGARGAFANASLRIGRAAVLAALACVFACLLLLAGAPAAHADSLVAAEPRADDKYQGGTIPILRFTFRDTTDYETGEPITGDESISRMNESPNHGYRASDVTLNLEVPSTYDNPEQDLWDGVSGYRGETDLDIDFIRGRGNSTWSVDKKPYKFKLDEKANLFGMGKDRHWVLLANYFDPSLTIDRMVGWLGDQMGFAFTPRGVPVDLFMNGTYYGSYLLMEEVRVDENRVDIDEVPSDASDPNSLEITGDYLLGTARKQASLPYEYFHTERNNCYSWVAPEYEPPLTQAQEAQQAYMKSFLERMEDAVYARDLVNSAGESVWDLIDATTFADMWWVQIFFNNPDAYSTPSTYLYKVRDTVDDSGTVVPGKLYWGPLWDFDFVWGSMREQGFPDTMSPWDSFLRQDPDFVALLKQRWEKLDGILQEMTREGGLLDSYLAEMDASWEADCELWPRLDDRWQHGTYQECIEELRSRIDARRAWVSSILDKLQTAYYLLAFMDGDEQVCSTLVQAGTTSYFYPGAMPDKGDLLFMGWFTADHEEYDALKQYDEDTTFYAEYVDASTVSAATDIFLGPSELWIWDDGRISHEQMPSDAVDQRIVWTSSDESIVTVDEDGLVTAVDGCLDGVETARATVTARLVGSGKEASVTVVVYDRRFVDIPYAESVTPEPKVTMKVGEYHQIAYTAQPYPSNLNRYGEVGYEIEDESIAEVSNLGVITAKKPGTTRVTLFLQNPQTYDMEPAGTIDLVVEGDEVEPGPGPDSGTDPAPGPDSDTDPEHGSGSDSDDPAPGPSEDDVQMFTIVYKLNGGSLDGKTADVREQHAKGERITILKAPVRSGYTFLYWKGSQYEPGDTYTVTGDHTFTAQWRKNTVASSGDGKTASSGDDKTAKTAASNTASTAAPKTGDAIWPFAAALLAVTASSGIIAACTFRRLRRSRR